MSITMSGVIHGRTIELSGDIDLPDGEPVEVVVRFKRNGESLEEKIRRLAGCLGADPEDDRILQEIYESRKNARYRELPE